jgi:hypothetical protein
MRIKLPAGSPKVTVEQFKVEGGRLTDLVLTVDSVKPDETQLMNVLFGDRFYGLNWQDGKLKLLSDAGDAASMLKLQSMQNWSNSNRYGYAYGYNQVEQTPRDRFNLMYSPLLSRSLNVSRESEARQVRLPTDIVRVYLYTKMPPEFAVQNKDLGGQAGNVLYCLDVPLAEK